MKITKIQLENFRNYQDFTHEFLPEKEITIFVGENGKGKTNFLEALYLLSIGRSFRTSESADLIKWDQDFARIKGSVEASNENVQLEVFNSVRPAIRKNFRKNEVNLRHSNYIGNFLSVLFHPEDLNMLYLSPSLRRRYLDIVLSQSDRHYLAALSKYKKIISQRNALLKQIRTSKHEAQRSAINQAHVTSAGGREECSSSSCLLEDLDAWDQEAIRYGSQVMLSRLSYVDFLSKNLGDFYNTIADTEAEITVKYSTKLTLEISTGIPTLEELSAQYFEALYSRRQVDIIRAETTVGPHRDDLIFSLNGHNILSSASRGEFRTLLLAIKLAEIEFIKRLTGHFPVLLLDDVFSELDEKRQLHLIKSLKGCQTIITTTELHGLDELIGECDVVNCN